MNIEKIKNAVSGEEYSFLRDNVHLGKNIIMLRVGGSYSYGTNNDDSDLDIRGIALNTKQEILIGEDFESFVDVKTDTEILSFNKIVKLLRNCNPNAIESLGCKPEHYLYISDSGRELIENKDMFLSKLCIYRFGGYANDQLRRLENKAVGYADQEEKEKHILNSIVNAQYAIKEHYYPYSDSQIELFIDDSYHPDFDKEIFINCNLMHYPLRDWCGLWNEMKSIVSSYNKIGKRNKHALDHNKIGKHMEHTLRLFMMVIDILENGKIITYRDKEHDLLVSIRNGEWIDDNEQPIPEFYDVLNEYEKKFEYAKKNTTLPDLPDDNRINEFTAYVNEKIVKGEY